MLRFACKAIVVLVAVLCIACDESVAPDEVEKHLTSLCAGEGTHHSAPVVSDETWSAAASPHHILTNLEISVRLTIEPGSVVCVAPGVTLRVANAQTQIVGTAERPILFTRRDTLGEWSGVELREGLSQPVVFRHVVIEDATRGIFAPSPVVVDSSVFRRISGGGITMWYYGGGITNSTFDSVGTGVVSSITTESGTFSNNIVRNSGPVTISVGSGCFACRTGLVDRLTVRSALGHGLIIRSPNVTVRNLTVTDSKGAGVHTVIHDGLRLEFCSVTSNAGGGVLIEVNDTQVRDCNIVGNQGFGLRATWPAADARLNYWGSPSGPMDPVNNRVEGNVQVDPFRTTLVQL